MSGRGSSPRVEGSPWNDIPGSQGANLCVDREGLKTVARRPDGARDRHVRARPSMARQSDLPDQVRQAGRAEADAGGGFGPTKKLTVQDQTSASGSGQMLPLPMN